MRRAARVDANHSDIIDVLRKAGCTVLDMSRLGNGAPDVALGYGGLTMLAEIKDGAKRPSKRVLTPDEQRWHYSWTGGCRLILSPSDALEAANTLRRWAMQLRTMPIEPSVYESGAEGRELDQSVADIEDTMPYGYSSDWAVGGPIIERERIDIGWHPYEGGRWLALAQDTIPQWGQTPLIAAMRCYVASKSQ